MSVKAKKEYVNVIYKRIEQEEVIEYKANYCEVNYEYEHVKEVDYVKIRPYLIDDEHIEHEIVEIIEEKKDDCLKPCLK